MPRPAGISTRQQQFLRAFRETPAGPPPTAWPAPAILRRWLRRPAFRRALDSLQQTLQLQSDFHLAAAAAHAARNLADPAAPPDAQRHLPTLLRLAHLRQRFAPTAAPNDAHDPQSEIANPKSEIPPPLPPPAPPIDWKQIPPATLDHLAYQRGWKPPLQRFADVPLPETIDDYQRILQDVKTLLLFLDRYDKAGNDHRFSPILAGCRELLDYCHRSVRQEEARDAENAAYRAAAAARAAQPPA